MAIVEDISVLDRELIVVLQDIVCFKLIETHLKDVILLIKILAQLLAQGLALGKDGECSVLQLVL